MQQLFISNKNHTYVFSMTFHAKRSFKNVTQWAFKPAHFQLLAIKKMKSSPPQKMGPDH